MRFFVAFLCNIAAMTFAGSCFAFSPTYFTWPDHSGYNLDQILRIERAPTPEFGGFFWSHQFYVGDKSDHDTMYMGLQQQQDGRRNVIMSIFYKPTTVVDAKSVKCPLPADRYISCQASQKAGDQAPGAQIVATYPWVEGRDYRLRVWNVDGSWWNFYVMDMTTKEETLFGSIDSQDFPKGRLNPTNSSVQWEEVFGGQQSRGNCAYSPQKVVWTSPTMDNLGVLPKTYGYDGTQAPFKIFPESGNRHYETLTCPLGGVPMGNYGASACYYLGDAGKSCSEVCTSARTLPTTTCSAAVPYTLGGIASDRVTSPYLGTPGQGGDVGRCDSVLAALQLPKAEAGTRINPQEGLGCHRYAPKSWWLLKPDTTAASSAPGAQRICGCGP
ncbi:hypothetical protein [Methylosinus sp. RM1]|uniref:DUF3472 domain-containing protein n=1 Tax=Methylosinus sp. RM1 TaxID=2583817 RepID=UPI00140844C4|nr:hypothetical protein [Methylosinus sp. RM1]